VRSPTPPWQGVFDLHRDRILAAFTMATARLARLELRILECDRSTSASGGSDQKRLDAFTRCAAWNPAPEWAPGGLRAFKSTVAMKKQRREWTPSIPGAPSLYSQTPLLVASRSPSIFLIVWVRLNRSYP
jgi:hypothetical protein